MMRYPKQIVIGCYWLLLMAAQGLSQDLDVYRKCASDLKRFDLSKLVSIPEEDIRLVMDSRPYLFDNPMEMNGEVTTIDKAIAEDPALKKYAQQNSSFTYGFSGSFFKFSVKVDKNSETQEDLSKTISFDGEYIQILNHSDNRLEVQQSVYVRDIFFQEFDPLFQPFGYLRGIKNSDEYLNLSNIKSSVHSQESIAVPLKNSKLLIQDDNRYCVFRVQAPRFYTVKAPEWVVYYDLKKHFPAVWQLVDGDQLIAQYQVSEFFEFEGQTIPLVALRYYFGLTKKKDVIPESITIFKIANVKNSVKHHENYTLDLSRARVVFDRENKTLLEIPK